MFKKISFITLSTLFVVGSFLVLGNRANAQESVSNPSDCLYFQRGGYYFDRKTQLPCTPTQGQVLGAESYYFTAPMKLNSIGAEVKELQKFLNNKGYNAGGVDGQFGPMTKSAVIKFQTANNISADGVVGPATRTLLNTK